VTLLGHTKRVHTKDDGPQYVPRTHVDLNGDTKDQRREYDENRSKAIRALENGDVAVSVIYTSRPC
jgi:hypothetical protein